MTKPSHPLLDRIRSPQDLRVMEESELPLLAEELRRELIDVVSKTGGHLGAGLGVVELTLALHYIFETPRDRLIWDVGHQSYPHKILTGRRAKMKTLRQKGGLSGFTKRTESDYDPFGAAHASTSLSAGLGMAVARDLRAKQEGARADHHIVCVIGDGAMSGGMAYEAMNNAGSLKSRLIVILNDNDMSIARPVGAMSAYLARLISSRAYIGLRGGVRRLFHGLPRAIRERLRRFEEYARGFFMGGTLFEEMGFYYTGPLDGHNFKHLLPVLRNVRDIRHGPVLVHVVTRKGKGYPPAEAAADKYHGVSQFNIQTGAQNKPKVNVPSYTSVFADTLIHLAERDPSITAITAAMPSGTGLDRFAKRFPERSFDVGIAEQHAVTFAAGMAAEGFKPFAAIYATFLQRAYDQIVHDVAIQKLPVRFAIDRAGLVGADGPTHAGAYDIAMLAPLPNFILMAASDEEELARMVATAAEIDDAPSAFRYPRGTGEGAPLSANPQALEVGRGRIVKEGSKAAILSYGGRLYEALGAAESLKEKGVFPTIADARFAKPLDEKLIRSLVRDHALLFTLEEGAAGGFGAHVALCLARLGLLDDVAFRPLYFPDRFIDQASPQQMYEEAGLLAEQIAKSVLEEIQKHKI